MIVSVVWPEAEDRTAQGVAVAGGAVHVAIHSLYKRYPGQQVDALQNVDLRIRRGEIFGIIGRSGAGKSSLIRCLNRLEDPTAGQVVVDGVDIGSLSATDLVHWRRSTGMIFQHFNLLSAKTVRQNIDLPLRVAGVPPAERRRKVDELLKLVGLEERQYAYPAQLSGGQKQRVGIARALVHDPQLLLCDEATSALDPETTRSILMLLRDINRQKKITIVLITHEMDVIHDLCHQVAVLERGEVIEQGPVWQVYGDPQQDTTRILLNPLRDSLPEALATQLTEQPQSPQSRALLCLNYTGQGAQPQLSALTAALGSDITLLQSKLEWVQGRQVGQILLLAAAQAEPLSLPHHATFADRIGVLGYVTAT